MRYDSPIPWNEPRAGAGAIYCSDGRFGELFDEFIVSHLGLPFYDRIALPGGCACLAEHAEGNVEGDGVCLDLDFLVKAHGLRRIVLIQHHGCAFYSDALGLSPDEIEAEQRRDLQKAAQHIRSVSGELDVDGWLLRLDGEAVVFESVDLRRDTA